MNLNEYPSEFEGVAERAAAIYGQAWNAVPAHTRSLWLDGVKDAIVSVSRGGEGQTHFERCACQAVREWQKVKWEKISEVEKPAKVEKTPKKPAK